MKTLYITDLDGTLLNSKAELSEKSAEIINRLADEGILFSLSTARTHATVSEMFSDVKLNVPLVMMNGVVVYDPKEHKVISACTIEKDKAEKVLEIYRKHGKAPMLYYIDGTTININYTDLKNENQQKYINSRNDLGIKRFFYSPSLTIKDELIYIVTLDPYEELKEIYDEVSEIEGLNCMFYSDNYTGCYFLEILSSKVSKGISADFVKKYVKADRMVAFGDNLNDISLFQYADEGYAVENAHEKLKEIATGVIGRNDDDAVAEYISEKVNIKI